MNAPLVQEVSLAQITADESLQPREGGLNDAAVSDYADALNDGAKFPPLVVYADTDAGTFWLSEGFHRYAAYVRAKRNKVTCEVRKGTRADALVNACGSNATNGLRRTNADKRRAVGLLLAVYPKWSDLKIAKTAAVTDKTVASVRNAGTERKQSDNRTSEIPNDRRKNDAQGGTEESSAVEVEDDPEPGPESDAPPDDATEDEPPAAVAPVRSEREELATLADVLRERLEAFAKTPEGADLFTTKVAAGPLVRDVAAIIGAALRAAKPDRGPIFAAERKTVQDVKHAERVDPSERLIEPQCVFLCELLRVLRGAKH